MVHLERGKEGEGGGNLGIWKRERKRERQRIQVVIERRAYGSNNEMER